MRLTAPLFVIFFASPLLATEPKVHRDLAYADPKNERQMLDVYAPATGAKFSLLPPENATGNYVKVVQRVPVKRVLDQGQDTEHQLRPGMSVLVKVRVK